MEVQAWITFFVFVYFNILLVKINGQDPESNSSSDQYAEAHQLMPYKSYRDVQIYHFKIPSETLVSHWEFFSNGSSHCHPRSVSVYLQPGSYPIADPANSTFPRFVYAERETLQHIEIKSDSKKYNTEIFAPLPGDWFAVAFIHDDDERIAQKGLFFPCQAWLAINVKFQRADPDSVITIIPGIEMHVSQTSGVRIFKFHTDENIRKARISVQKCSRLETQNGISDCPLLLSARPMVIPLHNNTSDNVTSCSLYYDPISGCSMEIIPVPDGWNYIVVNAETRIVEYALIVITESCQNLAQKPELIANLSLEPNPSPESLHLAQSSTSALSVSSCPSQQPLVRNTLPGNFEFEYVYPPDENGSAPIMFNLTNHVVTQFPFRIFPFMDIGGTLAVQVALPPYTNITSHNISVTGCLQHIFPSSSSVSECPSKLKVHVNTSSSKFYVGAILIPFPEAGNWYLSLQPDCYFHELERNESEVLNVRCDTNTTNVILRIKSAPCILGKCGTYGHCHQYFSGGFLFSSCVCIAGWRGWGCTDGSQALSDSSLLIAVLLLTLSNIIFIPTIVLALYRRHYTEALVYIATMFFSTFYHACDAEVYSFCLLRLSVLQFCDFYSAILSFWVTLMAMADLPDTFRSLGHMGGAIGIALGVEYDRTGLWVFVIPVSVGVVILCTSWGIHCRRQHACYPRKKTWLMCLLPGIVLVAVGLVLFAFLETMNNYAYVHSAWHATMALAVLFLLPERRYGKGRDDATNTCSYIRIEELSDISPSIDYGTQDQLLPPSP